MKLIEPKIELLQQKPGLQGIYEIIDQVAGICYNRQGMHKDSKDFVHSLIKRGHLSPLEFGTVYLTIPYKNEDDTVNKELLLDSCRFHYSEMSVDKYNEYITTNYREIIELHLEYLLKYICEPTEHHTKRPCFKITCSRGIADEFARHRTLSVMMRSTRYCKVDNLEICRPQWLDKSITEDILNKNLESDYEESNHKLWAWWYAMCNAENCYRALLENDIKPQEARGVLPLDIATEMCLCGFSGLENQGWDRFLDLRCSSAAHPDAQYFANQIKQEIYRIENWYKNA